VIKKLYTDNYNHHHEITGFGRNPRCTGGIDKVYYNKLKKVLECWLDMHYKIQDCSQVRYGQCTTL